MKLPKEVKLAINKLKENHYEAYIVGGAVRDYLLKITPSDYDITTNAKPEEIMAVFKDYHLLDQGLKHGTVMVIINRKAIEITTYRIDEEYLDNRHPSKVTFTRNLREDLARRDFTINAFAYDEAVIDYFEGLKDLKEKIIRSVGDPNLRFTEDALRILRAIRFSCQLDFTIEEDTKKALITHKDHLKNISVERITAEFNKMLMTHSERMMPFYEIIKIFIPEIREDKYVNNLEKVVLSEKNHILRLALFFKDINDVDLILNRLRYPILTIKAVKTILNNQSLKITNNKILFKKLLNKIKYEDLVNIIKFKLVQGEKLTYEQLDYAKDECYQLKDLQIDGNDLVSLKIPHKMRGKILNEVLNLVIEEKLKNDKKALINYVFDNFLS